jgi:hypothetical protein
MPQLLIQPLLASWLLWTLLPIGLFSLVLALVVFWSLRRARKVLEQEFADRNVIKLSPMANFFGQESLGVRQMRGNGTLVLTDDELWFRRLLPKRDYSVPLNTITGVGTKKSHLGKTRFKPLLHVEYATPAGPDSIAWDVPNVDEWVTAVRQAAGMSP